MRCILALCILPLLAGCPSLPPKEIVVTKIVPREVPYPVPCKIIPPQKPVFPVDGLKKEDDLFRKSSTALAELELRIGYEKELEAAIKGCQ